MNCQEYLKNKIILIAEQGALFNAQAFLYILINILIVFFALFASNASIASSIE